MMRMIMMMNTMILMMKMMMTIITMMLLMMMTMTVVAHRSPLHSPHLPPLGSASPLFTCFCSYLLPLSSIF